MFNKITASTVTNDIVKINRTNSYNSTRPVLANFEKISPKWRQITENIVFRDKAQLPDAHMVSISDATVFGNGILCTNNMDIITETIQDKNYNNKIPDMTDCKKESGEIFLLRKNGDSNFGHWIVELLPRVREFKNQFSNQRLRFGIPLNPYSMIELRMKTLEWAGVNKEDIYLLPTTPIKFDKITFITSNSIHSHTHDYDGVRHVNLQTLSAIKNRGENKYIYVARKNGSRRNIINEDTIVKMLESMGFFVVYPEDLSIEKQVELFSGAEIIIGPSGAALTNIMWAPKECSIISLNPNYGHEFFFWDISCILKQKFFFIFGDSVDPEKLGHSDFEIDKSILKKYIEHI